MAFARSAAPNVEAFSARKKYSTYKMLAEDKVGSGKRRNLQHKARSWPCGLSFKVNQDLGPRKNRRSKNHPCIASS
jgi:hypothetical protein